MHPSLDRIYVFAGAVFFIGARHSSLPSVFSSLLPAHYLFGSWDGSSVGLGRSLFLLWLGGAYAYIIARWLRPPPLAALAIAVLAFVAYLLVARAYREYQPTTYPLLVLFVLEWQRRRKPGARSDRRTSRGPSAFFQATRLRFI